MITHGGTRNDARLRLIDALGDTVIWPVRSNAGFLVKALEHPDFSAARLDTGLIARESEALLPPGLPSVPALADAAAALVAPVPLAGFRLNAASHLSARFLVGDEPVDIEWMETGDGPAKADGVLLTENGQTWLVRPFRASGAIGGSASDGEILAPMPGRVIAVDVAVGEAVEKGQKLLTLEAMKMEHALTAPFDGTVGELSATAGAQVRVEALLARILPVAGR